MLFYLVSMIFIVCLVRLLFDVLMLVCLKRLLLWVYCVAGVGVHCVILVGVWCFVLVYVVMCWFGFWYICCRLVVLLGCWC